MFFQWIIIVCLTTEKETHRETNNDKHKCQIPLNFLDPSQSHRSAWLECDVHPMGILWSGLLVLCQEFTNTTLSHAEMCKGL